MSYFNFKVYDGYAVNNADGYTFQSPWVDVKQISAYSISVRFSTGSPSGTLHLECSNEPDLASPYGAQQGVSSITTGYVGGQPYNNGLDATTITGTSTAISATGTTTFDVALPGHRWVRAVYVASSGTTTVTVNFAGKGF